MFVTDLPVSAAPHPDLPNVWDDPQTRTRYYLDPNDPLLLVSREWTDAEIAAENDKAAVVGVNKGRLAKRLGNLSGKLAEEIGPKPGTPEYLPGTSSLRGILHPDSTANAATKALARYQLTAHQTLIALAKLQLSDLNSAALGAE